MNSEKKKTAWIESAQGESGVDYQRSAQITWWSILQGIAVGALVLNFPEVLSKVSQTGEWFLLAYMLTSFLIVVNVWVQMAWAILILRWQISILHTTLILLLGVAVSVACTFVDTPKYWIPSIVGLVALAIIVYIYNIKNRAYLGLTTDRVYRIIGVYAFFLLLCVAATVHVWNKPTNFVQTFWGIVFLIMSIAALYLQERQMKHERTEREIL